MPKSTPVMLALGAGIHIDAGAISPAPTMDRRAKPGDDNGGVDRRRALKLLARGGLAAALVPAWPAGARTPGRRLYLSAKEGAAGGFFYSGFEAEHGEVFAVPLPDRGHGAAVHPTRREAALFARRPGRFAVIVALPSGAVVAELASAPDRSFNGHGAYSGDGALLFATESDYAQEAGFLAVFDVAGGYRHLGAMATHGLDPHEVRLLGDGRTLVVANGGLLMDRTARGVKLNVPTMDPSLVYLDARDGARLRQVRLPRAMHQLSIRHLALAASGAVAVAMQYEGPAGDLVPLVALDPGEGDMRLLQGPPAAMRRLKSYCGSAAVDASGRVLAASAPRGGMIAFWDLAEGGRFLGLAEVADGSGIDAGAEPGAFIASSGLGGVFSLDGRAGTSRPAAPAIDPGDHWDNHLTAVAV
jgi:hypothetical protein